jgi:putative ABC transport system permease protein
MSEFINGSYSMSEIEDDAWELVFDSNACMINSELASLNEISIGDTISVSTDDNTLELTVVGIFDESDSEGGMSMFSNSANTILTNVDVVASLESETYTVTPTYILSSYDDVDGFQEELYEKGLDENYTVTTNLDEVESATSSISNVSSFATTFLVLTFVIGAVVLLVINQINIRERKYEIGVLRTIGMKKSLLTLQFLCELLIVSFMALMLGCALGACASKPVGNSLLKQEIASSEANTEALGERFGGNDKEDNKFDVSQALNKPTVQAYSSINAVVDVKVILELLGICTLLMVIGSLTAILSIQRFSPLEILKERS